MMDNNHACRKNNLILEILSSLLFSFIDNLINKIIELYIKLITFLYIIYIIGQNNLKELHILNTLTHLDPLANL